MTTITGSGFAPYLPEDRLRALTQHRDLPDRAQGSILFADIVGFTRLTERLMALHGRHGVELLSTHLNHVYGILIDTVQRHSGVTLHFSGDAILCWFAGEAPTTALQATGCGLAIQVALQDAGEIYLTPGETARIAVKIAIGTGLAGRFLVGDPTIQRIDTLAGDVVLRVAAGERLARRGEVVVDAITANYLGSAATISEWRTSEWRTSEWRTNEHHTDFAVIILPLTMELTTAPPTLIPDLPDEVLRPWVLPDLYAPLQTGLSEFLTELRPAAALFVRFTGIDYETDPTAGTKLDIFVQEVQHIVRAYGGNVLQVTLGDKGNYLYAAFGAPLAHEDDVRRALDAALQIRDQAKTLKSLAFLQALHMGLSQGMMRTGAYGSETRRTYGVLGDATNLAARLMEAADPDTLLLSESVWQGLLHQIEVEPLPALRIKGKEGEIPAFRFVRRSEAVVSPALYSTPFVGRDSEFEAILARLRFIFEGHHAGLITIYGEPGMGKSRLAQEIQHHLAATGEITWFVGQTDSLQRTALGPFSYFLRHYFNPAHNPAHNPTHFDEIFAGFSVQIDEPALRRDLERYRSFLAGLVGLSLPGSPYDLATTEVRLDNSIAAIQSFIRAAAHQKPVVLHLEDAQWFDKSSITAVRQLLENMDDVALAILITSRHAETADDTEHTSALASYTLDLTQLHPDSIRHLTCHLLAGRVSESLIKFVQDKVAGNPFFAEQLVSDLRERGVLAHSDDGWILPPDIAHEVPATVNAILIARLDRLASEIKAIVQTAAVLGGEFDSEVLARMVGRDVSQNVNWAEREAIWAVVTTGRYRFRHLLLRDAAYGMLTHNHLKKLHHAAATAIESVYPTDNTQIAALAEHWRWAEDPVKELYYATLSAEQRAEVSHYREAIALASRALTLTTTPVTAIRLHGILGDTYTKLGNHVAARRCFTEQRRLAGENSLIEETAKSLCKLGISFLYQPDYVTALTYLGESLALARQHDYRRLLPEILISLNWLMCNRGNIDSAITYARESLQMAYELGDERILRTVRHSAAWTFGIRGDFETAFRLFSENEDSAQRVGDQAAYMTALYGLGWVAEHTGDWVAARRCYDEALHTGRKIGSNQWRPEILRGQGRVAAHDSQPHRALQWYAESLKNAEMLGDQHGIADTQNMMASVYLHLNALDQAQNALQSALQTALRADNRLILSGILINFISYCLTTNQPQLGAEIYYGICQHTSLTEMSRQNLMTYEVQLKELLSPNALKVAASRAQSIDLDTLAARLLVLPKS